MLEPSGIANSQFLISSSIILRRAKRPKASADDGNREIDDPNSGALLKQGIPGAQLHLFKRRNRS